MDMKDDHIPLMNMIDIDNQHNNYLRHHRPSTFSRDSMSNIIDSSSSQHYRSTADIVADFCSENHNRGESEPRHRNHCHQETKGEDDTSKRTKTRTASPSSQDSDSYCTAVGQPPRQGILSSSQAPPPAFQTTSVAHMTSKTFIENTYETAADFHSHQR